MDMTQNYSLLRHKGNFPGKFKNNKTTQICLGTNQYFSNGGGGLPFFKGLDTIFFLNFSLSKQFFLKSLSGRQFIFSIY